MHDILAKQVHNKTKARDLCISDIKRLPAEVVDCPLLLAATLDDPTIIKYMVEKHEVRAESYEDFDKMSLIVDKNSQPF